VVFYQNCLNGSDWLHKWVMVSKNSFLKCNFQKSFFLNETTRPRAFIFGIYHHLDVLYQSCSNYAPGIKIDPAPGSQFINFTLSYIRISSNNFFLKPLMGILPNLSGMIPGWSPTKFVQMVLIGCISRSQGLKLGFPNAIFKNLLV